MKHIGLFYTILLFISFSCTGPAEKVRNEQPTQDKQNDLPKMTVTTSSGSSVNLYELKGNTILILFQPDCDHCQREAREIRQHLEEFKNYTLYFISADQLPSIQSFAESFDLTGHANINFASTTSESVLNNFGPIPAPSVYIYSEQRLIKKFNGEVGIDKILQVI